MVLKSGEVWIPMPRTFYPKIKVVVVKADGGAETDITARILRGNFIQTSFRTGKVGTFNIEITNLAGIYSTEWSGGDTIIFYADLIESVGTTEIFKGRIDALKKKMDTRNQGLVITGRHISYLLTEKFINKTYDTETIDKGIKDVVDTHLTGLVGSGDFTYLDVEEFETTIKKNFSGINIIRFLSYCCERGGADGYVDNDLGIHFFKENSRLNRRDAFADKVKGRRLFWIRNYGEDTYYERDKVTVYGVDDEGLKIIHTAGTGERYTSPIFDSSITIMEEAKAVAEAKLAELTDVPPQSVAKGYGLPYLKPGENMMIFSPRNQIAQAVKGIEINHLIGSSVGTWLCEVIFERETKGASHQLYITAKRNEDISRLDNEYDMEFSYNFNFNDDTNANHDNTETREGYLGLISGQTSGVMTSSIKSVFSPTQVVLKYTGENLEDSSFEVTVNNGLTWDTVTRDSLHTLLHSGSELRVRVNLEGATAKCYSVAILYR